ncbi:MAG: hypothetical protein EOM12_15070 [Verrucomicrobiae bacterium]|nr:hypothetical protein [Verrucomicrobiae bacterium]
MSAAAISVLDQVIREKPTRENRLTNLLKDPSAETAEGWYMCVPSCFNDALDIKQTERVVNKMKALVWTQGSSFHFNTGDTIYDTPDAYKVWSEALKTIGVCVQIKTGASAGNTEGGTGRFGGSVTFAILTPNKDRTTIVERGEHSMSQDDFVRFLISGPPEELKGKIERSQPEY